MKLWFVDVMFELFSSLHDLKYLFVTSLLT